MAVSVRMNPLLEKELELAAKRRGITKSQFIIEAVERSLGRKDPYKLMVALQAEEARGVYAVTPEKRPTRGATRGATGEFSYGVDGADAARAFIVRKLKAKHGGGGAG
jgi:predicted DNA-binding protein